MTYAPALAQRVFPRRTWYREIGVQLGGVLVMTALAHASVPLSPVPVTGQTLGVFLVGAWLGAWRAMTCMALYVGLGALGLPVFATGAGLAVLLGPTAGYLIGFVAAAGTVGLAGEHGFLKSPLRSFGILVLANLAIFVFGLAWLVTYVPSDLVLAAGLWPFLPGACVKTGIALLLITSPGQ